jgi:radical SAM superfamily enzyme YgiQ (UPF0313 family)
MFDDKRFKVRDIEDVFADIEQTRRMYPVVKSIFLIDGNVLAARTDFLLKVIDKIKHTFPELEHLAMYSGLNDFRRKSVSELVELKQAGLDTAYSGLESGDEVVLKRIKKHLTPSQAVEGALMAKEAGIEVLQSFIFGLGGRYRSQQHIEATVDLLNQMQPEQIAPMALAVQPGSELEREVNAGEFVLPTEMQLLEEEKYLLENMNFNTVYWGDHGNNMIQMRGMFPESKPFFLKHVNEAIAINPGAQENVIQTFAW